MGYVVAKWERWWQSGIYSGKVGVVVANWERWCAGGKVGYVVAKWDV